MSTTPIYWTAKVENNPNLESTRETNLKDLNEEYGAYPKSHCFYKIISELQNFKIATTKSEDLPEFKWI
jgi:hypothetical protein